MPECDPWESLHSARLAWVVRAPCADAVDAVRAALGAERHLVECTSTADPSVLQAQRTSRLGFRDDVRFSCEECADSSAEAPRTLLRGESRSRDYLILTACLPDALRPLAAAACCCGLLPTSDWGQNRRTLRAVVDAAFGGRAEEQSAAVASAARSGAEDPQREGLLLTGIVGSSA